MSNPWDEMEAFLRERRERATVEQERSESRELFEGLNAKVDSLAESVKAFIDRSAPGVPPAEAGTNAPPASGSAANGATPPAPNPTGDGDGAGGNTDDELPMEVVRRLDVPRIYTGDDEPHEVQYIDPETGETRARRGRRKGRVATYTVEDWEPPAPDDGGEA
jgi:hypothetical protein